jgi:hypothetical protein
VVENLNSYSWWEIRKDLGKCFEFAIILENEEKLII